MVIRLGDALEEVCGDASRIAAAVLLSMSAGCFLMVVLATIFRQVAFHADQSVGMVMMGKDGHCQHENAG